MLFQSSLPNRKLAPLELFETHLWTPTHFAELQIFQRYEVKSPGVRV